MSTTLLCSSDAKPFQDFGFQALATQIFHVTQYYNRVLSLIRRSIRHIIPLMILTLLHPDICSFVGFRVVTVLNIAISVCASTNLPQNESQPPPRSEPLARYCSPGGYSARVRSRRLERCARQLPRIERSVVVDIYSWINRPYDAFRIPDYPRRGEGDSWYV